MAEEDTDFVSYKDISELKSELEGMKGKKDISTKDLYDVVQKLAQAMEGMLEVFGAAAEQMKLEERESESESKKHEMILSKLDKLADQNKTIAEGMVAIVEMVKEKIVEPAKQREEQMFRPREEPAFKPQEDIMFKPRTEPRPFPEPRQFQEPRQFMRPQAQQEWQPRPEPMMPRAEPIMVQAPPLQPMPSMPPPPVNPLPPPDFGAQLPPIQPVPSPDFDFPEEEPLGLDEMPKKKGLFGMFKK